MVFHPLLLVLDQVVGFADGGRSFGVAVGWKLFDKFQVAAPDFLVAVIGGKAQNNIGIENHLVSPNRSSWRKSGFCSSSRAVCFLLLFLGLFFFAGFRLERGGKVLSEKEGASPMQSS